MTNIYTVLSRSTLKVFNDHNDIVSTAFILSFPVENKENTTRPFLIVNEDVLSMHKNLHIEMNFQKENVSNIENIYFSKDSVSSFKIEELNVYALPLANVLNEINKDNSLLELSGITTKLIPENDVLSSMDGVNEFTWFAFNDKLNQIACYQDKNITLLDQEFNVYFQSSKANFGAPVFIVNTGSFTVDNKIKIGTRLLFMGYFDKTIDGYTKLNSSKVLAEKIKQKFNFS